MPRKPNRESALNMRWNFFVNPIEKADFILALVKSGKNRCQSAALRAFMYLYVEDEDVRNKVNNIVDDFVVYKENGDTSRL